MRNKYIHGFSSIKIIIIVAAVALSGGVSWLTYHSLKKAETPAHSESPSGAEPETPPVVDDKCGDDTTAATKGVFCSTEMGIKFGVPSIFKGKIAKADNYDVFEGAMKDNPGEKAGSSELVFSAEITGNDNFTFTIAKEPLRTGYIGFGDALQNTYFNKDSGLLSRVNEPTHTYDPKTGMTTTTGKYEAGEPVPSFMVKGVRFYKGTVGDAGAWHDTYAAVINGKIIKIKLEHGAFMGPSEKDPATIDEASVFKSLEKAVRKLEVL